jgi:hypothetical protein
MKTLIDSTIRTSFPKNVRDFNDLEDQYAKHEERFISRTVSDTLEYRPIGANSVKYLLSILLRAKSLLEGFSLCLTNQNIISCYLIVRYHYESTGAVAFLRRELRKFADGTYTKEALADSIRTMTLGSMRYPSKSHPRFPKIRNVLDYIDEADKALKGRLSKPAKSPFRNNYDFLSEFCHPNAYSLLIGSNISKGRVVQYERIPKLTQNHLGILMHHLLLSSGLLPVLYDEAMNIVKSNFQLPQMEK